MAKRKKGKRRAPVTSATSAARQAIIQADVLGVEANRARTSEATKGAFGPRRLRAAGSLSQYLIGAPGGSPPRLPKSPRPPRPPRQRRPKRQTPPPKKRTKTKKPLRGIAKRVQQRRPGLNRKQVRQRAKEIRRRRDARKSGLVTESPGRLTPRKGPQ